MIYTIDNVGDRNIHKLGGKGANLFYLTGAGLPVPPWFVIPADVHLAESKSEIENFYHRIKKFGNVAVRSSAEIEDAKEASFAGQFKSFLNIRNSEELFTAIQQVRDSANSEEVRAYLQSHGKSIETINMAVIVQAMIDGDCAGVIFTANPITGDPDEFIINSAEGHETVVRGGRVDSYAISKSSGVILDVKLATFNTQQLKEELLHNLLKTGLKIESLYEAPQDIEWAVKDNSVFVLQSRPITTLRQEKKRLWDNANIAESYSGITLPLTASFARHVYSMVYQEVALTSGIPKAIVEDNKALFDNMLGFFKGRFYYNMYNWYRLLSFFPAFAFTKDSMERMMSIEESANFDEGFKMPKGFKLKYSIRAFYRFLTFDKEAKSFRNNFNRVYGSLSQKDISVLSADELIALYRKIESKILRTWHTPIDNDFLVMIFYGLLRRLTHRWKLDQENPSIHNDLLSNLGRVASTDQTHLLVEMAQIVRNDKSLLKFINENDAKIIWNRVMNGDLNADFIKAARNYLDNFGSRFVNELKLEEPNIQETPEKFVDLLKIYISIPDSEIQAKAQERTLVRQRAEAYLKTKLNPLQKMLITWTLRQSERFLKNREEMRLMRSNMFGFVRGVFKNIGQRFLEQGFINAADDVFYLEIDEVMRFIEGSSSYYDLKSLVALRIREYDLYRKENIENRFFTRGIPYSDLPLSKPIDAFQQSSLILKGIPCSSGKAQGEVQVMENFSYTIGKDVKILIAKHTDPGWTPIFSRFSGIIVENGGQLSHAAIVSRELGIPCIVGVGDITQLVRSGESIAMDGSRGEVIIQRH